LLFFILKRVGMMVLTMLVTSIVLFLVLEINIESLAVKVLGQFSTDEQRLLWLERHGTPTTSRGCSARLQKRD